MAETMHDGRLLREYAEHGSQAAFARLVERYLRLVYSACLRETGEAGPAEDAAQAVFLLLARKAPSLKGRASLAGWLFAASRLVSRNAVRQERRRRRQEQKAMEDPLPGWLHNAMAIKMGQPDVVAGVPVQTVIVIKAPVRHDLAGARGESQTRDTPPFTDQTKLFLAIGVKDHLLRRLSWVNTLLSPGLDRLPGGTVILVQMETHRGVRANPVLAASTWAFTPPPGFMLGDAAAQAAPLKTPPLTPPMR